MIFNIVMMMMMTTTMQMSMTMTMMDFRLVLESMLRNRSFGESFSICACFPLSRNDFWERNCSKNGASIPGGILEVILDKLPSLGVAAGSQVELSTPTVAVLE